MSRNFRVHFVIHCERLWTTGISTNHLCDLVFPLPYVCVLECFFLFVNLITVLFLWTYVKYCEPMSILDIIYCNTSKSLTAKDNCIYGTLKNFSTTIIVLLNWMTCLRWLYIFCWFVCTWSTVVFCVNTPSTMIFLYLLH